MGVLRLGDRGAVFGLAALLTVAQGSTQGAIVIVVAVTPGALAVLLALLTYAPEDPSFDTATAATASSWLSILARTSRCAIWARSATVILLSSKGTSMSRNCDFKTLSRNSKALSCTETQNS